MYQKLLDRISGATSARELKLGLMDVVGAPFGAGAAGLYLFGPDGAVAELYTRGVRDGFILAYEQIGRENDPILAHALRTRAAAHDGTVFPDDGWTRSLLFRECGGPWRIRHYLCVPIVIADEVVGTLNLGRQRLGDQPFGPRDIALATEVCRRVATRLSAFGTEPPGAEGAVEDLGRLSAERAHVRIHADVIERHAPRLGDDEAGALWDALIARHITPLDVFEKGDRTYLLVPAPEPIATAPTEPLTRREAQVVNLLAAGLTTKEIAWQLEISLHTVGAVLTSARRKLGVRSRVTLLERARRLGLVG
jgi:DNA-binding CsgD family transcriptional regulator